MIQTTGGSRFIEGKQPSLAEVPGTTRGPFGSFWRLPITTYKGTLQ